MHYSYCNYTPIRSELPILVTRTERAITRKLVKQVQTPVLRVRNAEAQNAFSSLSDYQSAMQSDE